MSTTAQVEEPLWDARMVWRHLTEERLGSYRRAAGHDLGLAFALYEWNMRASAAVMTTTGMVEVIVRNAMDVRLREWADQRHGRSWFDAAPLDAQGRADLDKARERATRQGRRPEMHGKVIAELSLGFWRFMASSRYLTSLWIPAVADAFRLNSENPTKRRAEVELALQNLQFVRNRAAHHEPIHRRNLRKDHEFAVGVTSWISPDCAAWVAERSPIPGVVADRPC